MNSGPLLFLGMFVTMAVSWLTFVMGPQLQIGRMEQATNTVSALQERYPNPYPGDAAQGAQVYRANGCVACHTQQIRSREFGPDIARYFGIRQSTGYDYLFDQPVLLGEQRIGPDLSAVGDRMDRNSLLLKLYDPRLGNTPKSVMPSFAYLFDTRRVDFNASSNALQNLPPDLAAPAGFEIVPSAKAEQLAAYLLSRRQNAFIYYAPAPPTNAPATNAPAKS
jgi:cytochrome c oxidase cbb3-type subunit 2